MPSKRSVKRPTLSERLRDGHGKRRKARVTSRRLFGARAECTGSRVTVQRTGESEGEVMGVVVVEVEMAKYNRDGTVKLMVLGANNG